MRPGGRRLGQCLALFPRIYHALPQGERPASHLVGRHPASCVTGSSPLGQFDLFGVRFTELGLL